MTMTTRGAVVLALAAATLSCGGAGRGVATEQALAAAMPASASWLEGARLDLLPDNALAVIAVRDLGRLQALIAAPIDDATDEWRLVAMAALPVYSAATARELGLALDRPAAMAILPDGMVAFTLPVTDHDAFAAYFNSDLVARHGDVSVLVDADLLGYQDYAQPAVQRRVAAVLATPPERSVARLPALALAKTSGLHAPDALVYLEQRGLRAAVIGDLFTEGGELRRPEPSELERLGVMDDFTDEGYPDEGDPGDEDPSGEADDADAEAELPETTVERWREQWTRWGVTLGAAVIGLGWTEPTAITVDAIGAIDDRGVGWASAPGVAQGVEALLALTWQRIAVPQPPSDLADRAATPTSPETSGPPATDWSPAPLRDRHLLAAKLLDGDAPLAVFQVATERSPHRANFDPANEDHVEQAARGLRLQRGLGTFVAAASTADGVPRLRGALFFDRRSRDALAGDSWAYWAHTRRGDGEGDEGASWDVGSLFGSEAVGGYRLAPGTEIRVSGSSDPDDVREAVSMALSTVQSACEAPLAHTVDVVVTIDGGFPEVSVTPRGLQLSADTIECLQVFLSVSAMDQGKVVVQLELAYVPPP